jgi:RimJ/RimL family protein N-acetyltransferase
MVAATDVSFVVRLAWINEAMHGYGFGREPVAAVVSFATRLGQQAVLDPVVEQNLRSRDLAESLGGHVIGKGTLRKASGVELPN